MANSHTDKGTWVHVPDPGPLPREGSDSLGPDRRYTRPLPPQARQVSIPMPAEVL